jgi:hypothetical protein
MSRATGPNRGRRSLALYKRCFGYLGHEFANAIGWVPAARLDSVVVGP